MSNIDDLIKLLDTTDSKKQREIGEKLRARGAAAIPSLVRVLETSNRVGIRRPTAFLLGYATDHALVLPALEKALINDSDPKVRKNSALALGRLCIKSSEEALIKSLKGESFSSVRTSVILAVGKLGGEHARAFLSSMSPTDARETEALRKALDRLGQKKQVVRWRKDRRWSQRIILEAPLGLESVALSEINEKGIPGIIQAGGGRIETQSDTTPWDILPKLRCIYGFRIPIGAERSTSKPAFQKVASTIETWINEIGRAEVLSQWFVVDESPLRFRWAVEHCPYDRRARMALLKRVRDAASPFGLSDSPSNYSMEMITEFTKNGFSLYLRPAFDQDNRFDYRNSDVGASINPVVGACLARLAFSGRGRRVLDPTCGSGTLLIERAMLDDSSILSGLDISKTSIDASMANMKAAGLTKRVTLAHGDSGDGGLWFQCDEVIANLPFGLRTRSSDHRLADFYHRLTVNLSDNLTPGGRCVLFTTARKTLDTSLKRVASKLHITKRLSVNTGGLKVFVWVVERWK